MRVATKFSAFSFLTAVACAQVFLEPSSVSAAGPFSKGTNGPASIVGRAKEMWASCAAGFVRRLTHRIGRRAAFEKGLQQATQRYYHPEACALNVLEVLRDAAALGASGGDLKKCQVLVITSRSQNLWTLRSKEGVTYFGFHVALVHNGRVFDGEYADGEPAPSVQSYLRRMFLPGTLDPSTKTAPGFTDRKVKNDVMVMSVPALDFMCEMGLKGADGAQRGFEYYTHGSEAKARYRPRLLGDVLRAGIRNARPSRSLREYSSTPRLFVVTGGLDGPAVFQRDKDLLISLTASGKTINVFDSKGSVDRPDQARLFMEAVVEKVKTDPVIDSILSQHRDRASP